MSQHDKNRKAIRESILALEDAEARIVIARAELKKRGCQENVCGSISGCKEILSEVYGALCDAQDFIADMIEELDEAFQCDQEHGIGEKIP